MRPKRSCSIKSQNIVSNYFNLLNDTASTKSSIPLSNHKLRSQKSFLDVSSNESVGSSKVSLKENIHPPPIKRLRSYNLKGNKPNGVLQESNISIDINLSTSPPPVKRQKLLRSNSCISAKPSTMKTQQKVITSPIQKVIAKSYVPKEQHTDTSPIKTRYLLRSHSIRVKPTFPDHLFLTPQPPRKPLSEIVKITPHDKSSVNNLSQISEYSSVSSGGLSALALSRFIKKNTKTNKETTKKRKQMRIIESSFDTADSSSCTSVGDDSQNLSVLSQDPEKKILELCDQTEIKSWSFYFDEQSSKPINKIGEGVYGEVFRLSKGNVLKVFPVDGDILTNGEDQMTMEDVFPEVFVSRKLSELSDQVKHYRASNYVQLKKASLLKGKLPSVLVDQWNEYKEDKGTDNECLDFLPEKQKWMALEYEYAGEPLSNYKFNCYSKSRGVVEQIALSLAVAEAGLQFEHRDLHWQNILIKPAKKNKLRYRINNTTYTVSTNDIFVTIIDFTVARMCVGNNTVYMDMADCPEIFEGEGDYQFDIYRMMKSDNKNNWRDFHARSNLYWLHYLIDKLLHETSYPRGDPQSKTVEHELRQLYGRVLSYRSAQHLVDTDPYFGHCMDNCATGNDHWVTNPVDD